MNFKQGEQDLKEALREIALFYKRKNNLKNKDIAIIMSEQMDVSEVSIWRALKDDVDELPSLEKMMAIVEACSGKSVFDLLDKKIQASFKVRR